MSTKNKAQVQQEARAVDDDVDEKESTSPARMLAVDNDVDANNKSPARLLAITKVQRGCWQRHKSSPDAGTGKSPADAGNDKSPARTLASMKPQS